MPPSGMLRRTALVRTDVSEEPSAYIIRMIRIDMAVTMLGGTNGREEERV
jgi:hypothetical protein